MKIKYITYKDRNDTEHYVIFDQLIAHDNMMRSLQLKIENILGTGFISISGNAICCYGKSISLGIGSRGIEDDKLMERLNYL